MCRMETSVTRATDLVCNFSFCCCWRPPSAFKRCDMLWHMHIFQQSHAHHTEDCNRNSLSFFFASFPSPPFTVIYFCDIYFINFLTLCEKSNRINKNKNKNIHDKKNKLGIYYRSYRITIQHVDTTSGTHTQRTKARERSIDEEHTMCWCNLFKVKTHHLIIHSLHFTSLHFATTHFLFLVPIFLSE